MSRILFEKVNQAIRQIKQGADRYELVIVVALNTQRQVILFSELADQLGLERISKLIIKRSSHVH